MRVTLAKLFCKLAHFGQKRKYTGKPYWTHPFAVANLVKFYDKDTNTQIAAILHDTVEDTWVRPWMVGLLFGPIVKQLVMEVTDVSVLTDGSRKLRKLKDLQHLMQASADGQSIKIADIIHNAQSILKHDPNFAKVFLYEVGIINSQLYRADERLTKRLNKILSKQRL